jgi:protein TonB
MSLGEEVHAPLAAPTYLTHVTVPVFRRGRAIATAILLHLAAALIVLAVLHHRFFAITPDEATVALVIEPSPYVGTGPTVLAPKPPIARPQHARTMRIHATKAAAASANSTQFSHEVASPHSNAELRLPAPPSQPAPHPKRKSPDHATPPLPHLGDNQPPGYGMVVDPKIIPARPDDAANQPPAYPPDALSRHEQGRVLLSISVNPAGRASAVEIITSSGYAILDNTARAAVSDWHFLPADLAGKPVASTLLLPITFEIDANNQPVWGVSSSKQGQGGFAPLDPPLRAEPLEPDSGR